ncbi:hypothetical protein DRE_02645 [Drechslerella stenobrocha 248]|uniref:Uncharacterized protein n=1 Tax=Drechslerella stenobrocha 248 TaxID=1043628 RepID=W7HV59_9PEZI|nr:hypothetical protein DRE_02645 [Drechslerella stenobrocha 248]
MMFTKSSSHETSTLNSISDFTDTTSISSSSYPSLTSSTTRSNSGSHMATTKPKGADSSAEPNPFADPLNWYWIWYNNCLEPDQEESGPMNIGYYPPPKNMGEALKVAFLTSGIEITRVGQAFLTHRNVVAITSTELSTSTITNVLKNLEFIWDNKVDPKDTSAAAAKRRLTTISTSSAADAANAKIPPQVKLQDVFKKKVIQWKTWKLLHLLLQRSPMFEKFMIESADDFTCDPERPRINIREPLSCKLWRMLQIMVRFGLVKVPGGEFGDPEKQIGHNVI